MFKQIRDWFLVDLSTHRMQIQFSLFKIKISDTIPSSEISLVAKKKSQRSLIQLKKERLKRLSMLKSNLKKLLMYLTLNQPLPNRSKRSLCLLQKTLNLQFQIGKVQTTCTIKSNQREWLKNKEMAKNTLNHSSAKNWIRVKGLPSRSLIQRPSGGVYRKGKFHFLYSLRLGHTL